MLLKDYKFKTPTCTICYARNGHRLFEGLVKEIPGHLLNYYMWEIIYNPNAKNTYLEVTEDEGWGK